MTQQGSLLMRTVFQHWVRVLKLVEDLPPQLKTNEALVPSTCEEIAGRLTDACLWDAPTVRLLKKLVAATEERIKAHEPNGFQMWAELLLRSWEKVPPQLPPAVLKVFLDKPDLEPIVRCVDCSAAWPWDRQEALALCPGCASDRTIWEHLAALRYGSKAAVENRQVPSFRLELNERGTNASRRSEEYQRNRLSRRAAVRRSDS
jgi:hypothetical protein